MYHRRHNKGQNMLTEHQLIAFFDHHAARIHIERKKLRQHAECLRIHNNLRLRVFLHELLNISGMVRLHM